MNTLSIDIETRSKFNLKHGVYGYAMDPSTRVLCIAYKFNAEPTKIIIPQDGRDFLLPCDIPKEFLEMYVLCELNAFNGGFERTVLNYSKLGLPQIPMESWHCTQALSLYYNLPISLDDCSYALKLTAKKDKGGRVVMLQLCKPRNKQFPNVYYSRQEYPEKYEILYAYCITDVDVEDAIKCRLGRLPPQEQKYYEITNRINDRGLLLDAHACNAANKIYVVYKSTLSDRCKGMYGFNPSQRAKVIEYLQVSNNIDLQNKLRAETVDDLLNGKYGELTRDSILLINYRKEYSRTSLSKITAFLRVANSDNRMRGTIQYYGASVNGRWAGRLIQPQNLPRGFVKDLETVFNDLLTLEPNTFINKYPSIIDTLASCLRGFIIAPKDKHMFIIDYSAIEARVVAWLCDIETDLKAFRDNKCVYRNFGKQVFGYTQEECDALAKGSRERAILKEGILSLGYGVGHEKYGSQVFKLTNEAVDIRCKCPKPPAGEYQEHTCEAKRIVEVYRNTRSGVKDAWRECEAAVLETMQSGKVVPVLDGLVSFVRNDMWVHVRLPSGRVLRYPQPTYKETLTSWGEVKASFCYRGVRSGIKSQEEMEDPNFRQGWRRKFMYGAKFFQNICSAIARDIMGEAMIHVDGELYQILLTVHDEIVGVFDKNGKGNLKEICDLMTIVPDWCKGLPLNVEGELSDRYKK